jgi:hypothetical protein
MRSNPSFGGLLSLFAPLVNEDDGGLGGIREKNLQRKDSKHGCEKEKLVCSVFELSTLKVDNDDGTGWVICELLLLARHRRHYDWSLH